MQIYDFSPGDIVSYYDRSIVGIVTSIDESDSNFIFVEDIFVERPSRVEKEKCLLLIMRESAVAIFKKHNLL